MKNILILVSLLAFFAACDDRPPGVYNQGHYDNPINVKKITIEGIDYLHFNDYNTDGVDGVAVDFSQFFKNDTLYVNGHVWVNIGKEEDIRKEQRVPTQQEQP